MSETKPPPTTRPTCGTVTGSRKHTKAGEQQCDACRAARREYDAAYRAKKRAGAIPETKKSRREQAEQLGVNIAEVVTPRPPDDPRPGYPNYLKAAGRKLWDDVTADYQLSPASLSVLASACRMTDQCERFTAALSSGRTLWFELSDDDQARAKAEGIPVVVNGLVGEHRQLTNAIRTSLNQIGVLKTSSAAKSGGVVDEVKRRRAEREAAAKAASTAGAAQ